MDGVLGISAIASAGRRSIVTRNALSSRQHQSKAASQAARQAHGPLEVGGCAKCAGAVFASEKSLALVLLFESKDDDDASLCCVQGGWVKMCGVETPVETLWRWVQRTGACVLSVNTADLDFELRHLGT